MILKKECLGKTGDFNEQLPVGEDFDLFLRLCQDFQGGAVKEKLYKRGIWQGSLSKQDFELNRKVDNETLKKIIWNISCFLSKAQKGN